MTRRLRVVSLNLWKNEGAFPARLAKVARELSRFSPDVVCLQECFRADALSIDVAGSLAASLGLSCMHAPSRAKMRAHDGSPVWSTSGLSVLARTPVPVSVLVLPDDPLDGPRIAERARVAPGLDILNLHLTHLSGARGASLRKAQIDAALAWGRSAPGDLLVCGDLNAPSAAPEVAALFGAPDIDLGPDPRVGERSTLHAAPRAPAIDHAVLLRRAGGWRLAGVAHALHPSADDTIWPSDHVALIVDLACGKLSPDA